MRSATAPGLTVNTVARNRARAQVWAAEHRKCHRRNPWLLGAPPFGTHLPGGGFSIDVSPAPRWPVEIRNTRALHGMITALMGLEHHHSVPLFTLVPWPCPFGWAIYTQVDSAAQELAGRQHAARLYDREVSVTCGHLARVRAPVVRYRGRRRLRLDAITPVRVREESGAVHTMPTAANLHSTLVSWLPRRLGLEIPANDLVLDLVSRDTQPATVETGGKYGQTRGFVGSCVIETNAVGEWLLRTSALVGLGGRVAFGFGRVRVEAC